MKVAPNAVGLVIALGIAIGCSKSTPADAGAPDATVPINTASGKPAASARPADSAVAQVESELAAVTKRWNDALAKRDAEQLRDVYGARVRLYTSSTDRDGAIKAKRILLAASADYTQSIEKVTFNHHDPKLPRAEFDKKWTQGGKASSVRGSLTFSQESGKWVVVEESDAKTEKTVEADSCIHWVYRVVASTDMGSKFGPPKFETVPQCSPPECETYEIAVKEMTPGDFYFRTLTVFDVDQKAGIVRHGTGQLEANPAVVGKMKSVCAEKPFP